MIKFLVLDVDGTLTDGKIYMSNNGELFKAFDVKDGCGIKELLPSKKIIPIIITGRTSKLLELRCKEINIVELHQGVNNKLDELNKIINMYNKSTNENVSLKNVAYVGDDLPDLACITKINDEGGFTAAPNDAVSQIKSNVKYVASKNGGSGAVREIIDYIIEKEIYV